MKYKECDFCGSMVGETYLYETNIGLICDECYTELLDEDERTREVDGS